MNPLWIAAAFAMGIGAQMAEPIDINVATETELRTLPGIGAKKASDIINFRQRHPFRRSTELMRVHGIGPKLYNRIRERLRVSPTESTGAKQ